MHRQASTKFNTIKQGQKTVQELIQELTNYAAWMVQYPDDYSFRRWLLAALRPFLQKEVLHRGITAEFSSMQDILEKAKDIEDSSWYDIGSWMSVDMTHSNAYANQNMVKSSKWMIGAAPRGTAEQMTTNRYPNLFQTWVASAVINKLEEPVYNHRVRIKERSRSLWKCNDNQPIFVFWEIGRTKAHCLIDSGCEGIMLSPNFIRVVKIKPFLLDKPIGIQLAVTGSKSVINYGANMTIKYNGKESKEYFNIINIDYYDTIYLRNPIPKKTWSNDWLHK